MILRRPGVRDALIVVALALGFEALVLLVGTLSAIILDDRALGREEWLFRWSRWDANQYAGLATEGYIYDETTVHRSRFAFFPLYPWLVGALIRPFGDVRIAALFVSGVASVAAADLLFLLARRDLSRREAHRSALLFLAYPTALFLHVGYTESLFLAATLGAFLAARTGRWGIAGACAAAAGLTRSTGLWLVPALAAEALLGCRAAGRAEKVLRLWAALGGLLGFGGYLLLNRIATPSAWTWLGLQQQYWQKSLAPPWVGLRDLWQSLSWRGPAERVLPGGFELFFSGVSLATIVALCFRHPLRRASYLIWTAGNVLQFLSTGFLLSVGRYSLALFPLFLLLGRVGRRRPLGDLILVASVLLQALFTILYVREFWTF